MKDLKGRCIFAQSGGPTAVINSGIAGGITEALKNPNITGVLCAVHGIKGVLNEDFWDMSKEDESEIEALKHTPASAFGSVRYKLKNPETDAADYERILEVFKKYDVRFFFYNGGNDSMDTCDKISKYMQRAGYPVNVIGIPKTIDNDLVGTDHCPGYGSAAKYIATTINEIARDADIYEDPLVIIVEIMGRNAGWLTAAASLTKRGEGADLIYLPELPFDDEKFLCDVEGVVKAKKHCVVAVSEGIKYNSGRYVGEDAANTDVFGHSQLGGVCGALKAKISQKLGYKCKAIELNILQRAASHIASKTDVEETYTAGKQAVKAAVGGETDKMVSFKRTGDYEITYDLVPLSITANAEKGVPKEWITEDGTWLTEDFERYARPLIMGENEMSFEGGLPRYARLKKVKFKL